MCGIICYIAIGKKCTHIWLIKSFFKVFVVVVMWTSF